LSLQEKIYAQRGGIVGREGDMKKVGDMSKKKKKEPIKKIAIQVFR